MVGYLYIELIKTLYIFPKDISNIFLNRKYLGNEIIVNHYGEKEIAIITSRGCALTVHFAEGLRV